MYLMLMINLHCTALIAHTVAFILRSGGSKRYSSEKSRGLSKPSILYGFDTAIQA
jgi:hypothetical protein